MLFNNMNNTKLYDDFNNFNENIYKNLNFNFFNDNKILCFIRIKIHGMAYVMTLSFVIYFNKF